MALIIEPRVLCILEKYSTANSYLYNPPKWRQIPSCVYKHRDTTNRIQGLEFLKY